MLDKEGKQDAFHSFTHCHQANQCVQFHKGKIYPCAVLAYIKHFNKKFNQNFPTSENDSIDIYQAKSFAEITQFLSRPIPFCRYCKMSEWRSIGKWKKSSKTQEEYTQKYEE